MKKIKINRLLTSFCLCILVCISTINAINASDKPIEKQPFKPEPKPVIHNSTAIIYIKNINCTKNEYNIVKKRIIRSLHSIRYYIPVKSSDIWHTQNKHKISKRCISKRCIQILNKKIPAQKVIIGSIRKIEKEHERLLGTEGKKHLKQESESII